MKLLAVCESPPTVDARYGDGSTLISAELLARLPSDIDVDLVYFDDRPVQPVDVLLGRSARVFALPLAPRSTGFVSSLPRGSARRFTRGARRLVRSLSRDADVVYLHSLHTFAFADDVRVPVVAHEVDAWSLYWRERSGHQHGLRKWYDRHQAREAEALEGRTAATASRYLVVGGQDARALTDRFGRHVEALPNGVPHIIRDVSAAGSGEPGLIGFVGSLDYLPNVEAATRLVRDVLPLVAEHVPNARLFVAGRKPVARVLALAGPGVEIAGDIPDVQAAFARASVLVYPGTFGRGRKNTVLEAMAAGRPVVASPSAARGIERGDHIVVADSIRDIAAATIELLTDAERREALGRAAVAYTTSLPDWADVARRFARILAHAA